MKTIYCVGIMTGTSCDGADLAVLEISSRGEQLSHTCSATFPSSLRRRLREAQKGGLDLISTAKLERDYSEWIAAFSKKSIARFKLPVSSVLIAAHGQTVWHEPESHISVQLIDATIIAARTGATVTTHFRQPDLALGGQGAPLVPYYHWLRSQSVSEFRKLVPFAIHNVGGIGNLTYVTQRTRDLMAFDTGPGNALIDMAVEQSSRRKKKFDRGGAIAASAIDKIDWDLIESLSKHLYFKKAPPKSTGRELFNEAFLKRFKLTGPALVANATAFTAHTMAKAYADFIVGRGRPLRQVFVAGGGAQNPTLMRLFASELACLTEENISVSILDEKFAPPQFLEAMAFARLGYEAIRGCPVSLASVTGATDDSAGAGIFPGKNFLTLLQLLKLS